MTMWETLFGTPERTAATLAGVEINMLEICDLMEVASGNLTAPEKCKNCMFDFDRYGCDSKDMSLLKWLQQELDAKETP